MYVNIPIVKSKTYDSSANKVNIERGVLKVRIDTSFLAHLKWEQTFQEQMKCDLNEYTNRVAKFQNNKQLAKANFLGILKLLYCYIHSDDVPSFNKFLELLDIEVAEEILNILADVLTNITQTSVNEKK